MGPEVVNPLQAIAKRTKKIHPHNKKIINATSSNTGKGAKRKKEKR